MQPTLGWAALSRSALNRAEAQMVAKSEGVRDEMGVLALHTGYANRFFPGTSVQQTRLRYALFVPWQIERLLAKRPNLRAGQVVEALRKAELELAKRLPQALGAGTIGRDNARHNRSVSIPPSQSYWVGLAEWGILRRGLSGSVSRSDVRRRWSQWELPSRHHRTTDDENQALSSLDTLFTYLPPAPKVFTRGDRLDFTLLDRERDFLRARLLDTRRPQDGQPTLLSRLVHHNITQPSAHLWDHSDVADAADRAAMRRAQQAASLSVVARAVYNAMVETLQDIHDKRDPGSRHRDHLSAVVDAHGSQATRLALRDVTSPLGDGVALGNLEPVLQHIQSWLSATGPDLDLRPLFPHIQRWEQRRKDTRSKLGYSEKSAKTRSDWNAEKTALAWPINYRWPVIQRFLRDLSGQSDAA